MLHINTHTLIEIHLKNPFKTLHEINRNIICKKFQFRFCFRMSALLNLEMLQLLMIKE